MPRTRRRKGKAKKKQEQTPVPNYSESVFRDDNRSDFNLDMQVNMDETSETVTATTEPKPETSGQGRFLNYIPEDIDEDMMFSVNPCTFELPTDQVNEFSYHLFVEYHRLRSVLMYQAMKRRNGQLGKKDVALPSIDVCKERLEGMYGPIDFESNDPLMQKRLQIARESIQEVLAADPEDPVFLQQCLDTEIDPIDPYVCLSMLQEHVEARFKPGMQVKYGFPNPADAEGDWFLWPRPEPGKLRAELLPKLKPKFDAGSGPSTSKRCQKLLPANKLHHLWKGSYTKMKTLDNLHVYDPKFEFCFKPPYIIFNKCEQIGDEIPRKTSVRILEILNQFPYGVSPDIFWERFYKEHQYIPEVPDVPKPYQLLKRHEDEYCFVPLSKNQGILQPAHVADVIKPEKILPRIWHAIRCIVDEYSIIETNEILQEIENRYGFSFDPLNWGYPDVNQFLRCLMKKFLFSDELVIEEINYQVDNVEVNRVFLMLAKAGFKEELEILLGIRSVTPEVITPPSKSEEIPPIPEGFLTQNSTIPHTSDTLTSSEVHLCHLKTIHDPQNLVLVLDKDEPKAMQFHEDLQRNPCRKRYGMFAENEEFIPHPKNLAIGMIVLANIKWGSLDRRWYRVRILHINEKNNKYEVFDLDFGCVAKVELNQLRYMPQSVGTIECHAIPVRLLGAKLPDGEKVWRSSIFSPLVDELVDKDLLKVTFIKGFYCQTMRCKKWVVKCDVVRKCQKEEGDENEYNHREVDNDNKRVNEDSDDNLESDDDEEEEEDGEDDEIDATTTYATVHKDFEMKLMKLYKEKVDAQRRSKAKEQ